MAQDKGIITRYPNGKFPIEPLLGKDWFDVFADFIQYAPSYWLSAGALLGLIRENRLLPWDTDIDVGTTDDFTLKVQGYDLVRRVTSNGRNMQTVYLHKKTNILIDITHYYPTEDNPNLYFTEREDGRLYRHHDVIFPLGDRAGLKIPANPEEYLALWYEDWRTPDKEWETKWKE